LKEIQTHAQLELIPGLLADGLLAMPANLMDLGSVGWSDASLNNAAGLTGRLQATSFKLQWILDKPGASSFKLDKKEL